MTAAPTHAPLNVFQKVILQWERVHPYNGAQVMTLTSSPPADDLEAAWDAALHSLGLGELHLDRGSYYYNGARTPQPPPVPAVPAGVSLDDHLSGELNRPFPEGAPFRPFVRRHPAGAGCDLGVVYRHVVADSVSVRMLIREWFARLFDPARAVDRPAALPRHGYWRHLGPSHAGWTLPGALLSVPRTFSRFRRVRRPDTRKTTDPRTRFLHLPAPTGLPRALRDAASRRGATAHDLFLAAAAVACREHLPFRNVPRRTNLAVGSIVDLRPYSDADLSGTFGLFLGLSHVFCTPADLRDPDRLVRTISAQTRLHKSTRAAASGIVWMYLSTLTRRLVDEDRAYHFYCKHMPLAGGVSNVCLDRTWIADHHPAPLAGYTRMSPTGPMVPIAFTPTSLRDGLSVGLTFRPAVVAPPVANTIGTRFLDVLTRLI
jgi:hypothetical protein